METIKIIYWASTALVCLAMIFSSYSDLRSKEVKAAFIRFGFPAYFRIELGIMKMIGIILLVAPLPAFCKEWAYAGFAITFFSAFIAHTAVKDAMKERIAPLVILTFLLVSGITFHLL